MKRPRGRVVAVLVVFALLAFSPIAAAKPSPSPSPTKPPPGPTTVNYTVLKSDGLPMTGAPVEIYLWPSNPPTVEFEPALLWSGQTDAAGSLSANLDTTKLGSMVLGDTGTGVADAFNIIVIVFASPGNTPVVEHDIVHLGHSASARLQADPDVVAKPIVGDPTPLKVSVIDSGYRYIRVVAYNSAQGMNAVLTYTNTSSTSIQTRAEIATDKGGGWKAGQYQLEETSRTATGTWKKSGKYHYYVWANYKWVEYHYVDQAHSARIIWNEWHLNHWQGTLSDNNPNTGPSGTTIGVVAYDPPPFDTDPNHQVRLTDATSPWYRGTGQYKEYGFSLSMAGMLSLTDKATYASITSMKWTKAAGCSGTRYLWGDGTDPVAAAIVQASCV